MLQHNSKLSQNFDVSPITSVTYEARKQLSARQNYGKKNTELTSRQNKKNINQVRKVIKYGSNKENNRS